MGKYSVAISNKAKEDLEYIYKSGSNSIKKKIERLFEELSEHPKTGTGKPEQLKGLDNIWSRRIDRKDRLLYTIKEEEILVLVLSAIGHYNDK